MDWLTHLIDFLVKGGPISLSIGFNIIQALAIVWMYRDMQKRYERMVDRYEQFLDQNTRTLATVLSRVLHDDEEENSPAQRNRIERSLRPDPRQISSNPLAPDPPNP